MSSELLINILVCCLALILAVACWVFALFRKKEHLRAKVYSQAESLAKRVSAMQRRTEIVNVHATDYMNSLGSEGGDALNQLRGIIQQAVFLVQEITALLKEGSFDSLLEAQAMLAGRHPEQLQPVRTRDGRMHRRPRIAPDWHETAEKLLQSVGVALAAASFNATQVGIPKRFKRHPTLIALEQAGIVLRPNVH